MKVELEKLKDRYETANDEGQFRILCRKVYWCKDDELRVRLVDNTGFAVEVLLPDWNIKELKEKIHAGFEARAEIADYVTAGILNEENTIEGFVEERKECEVRLEVDTKTKPDNNVKDVVHEATKIIKFLNCTVCDFKTDKKSDLQKYENRHTKKILYPFGKWEKILSK